MENQEHIEPKGVAPLLKQYLDDKKKREKKWIADQIGVTRPTLDRRLRNDDFTHLELRELKRLKIIDEDFTGE